MVTHGHTRSINGVQRPTPTYRSWRAMKYRCSEGVKNKPHYIGVKVCDKWKDSFETFLEDMGERPSKEYSLERIDGSKGYYKENCRWATKKEQANNTKGNVFKGQSVKEKCELEGIEFETYNSRRKRGYSIEEALSKTLYNIGHDGDCVRGEKNANAKLTESDIIKIRSMKGKYSHGKIADMYGVSRPNISSILNEKTWRHVK